VCPVSRTTTTKLALLRAEGRDPARGGEAKAKRAEALTEGRGRCVRGQGGRAAVTGRVRRDIALAASLCTPSVSDRSSGEPALPTA